MEPVELLKELRLMKGQEGYRYCLNVMLAFACFALSRLLSPSAVLMLLIVISSTHQSSLSLLITEIGRTLTQQLIKP